MFINLLVFWDYHVFGGQCVTRVTFQINYHFTRNSIIERQFMNKGNFIPRKFDKSNFETIKPLEVNLLHV